MKNIFIGNLNFSTSEGAEGQHRCPTVELPHRRLCMVLARGGERGRVCRLGRRQCVRLRPEVRDYVQSKHKFIAFNVPRAGQRLRHLPL